MPGQKYLDGDGAFLGISLQVNLQFWQHLAFRHQLVPQFLQGIAGIGDELSNKHLGNGARGRKMKGADRALTGELQWL